MEEEPDNESYINYIDDDDDEREYEDDELDFADDDDSDVIIPGSRKDSDFGMVIRGFEDDESEELPEEEDEEEDSDEDEDWQYDYQRILERRKAAASRDDDLSGDSDEYSYEEEDEESDEYSYEEEDEESDEYSYEEEDENGGVYVGRGRSRTRTIMKR